MSATATPTKRRALGALDANVTRSPRSPSASSKLMGLGMSPMKKKPAAPTAAVASSRHATPTAHHVQEGTPKKKRPLVLEDDSGEADSSANRPSVKKLCSAEHAEALLLRPAAAAATAMEEDDVYEDERRPASQPRSISPDASSLFDSSAVINTSQLTNVTEPDAADALANNNTTTHNNTTPTVQQSASATTTTTSSALPDLPLAQAARRLQTREECRQRAEILRLRLSLATYKVKTNQADVPLEKLQVRPVPGMTPPRRATPLPSMTAHTVQRATPAQYWYRSSRAQIQRVDVATAVLTARGKVSGGDEDEEGEVAVDKEMKDDDDDDDDVDDAMLPVLSTPRKGSGGPGEDEVERLTSSGLRGGAAKGLLSLSQGS